MLVMASAAAASGQGGPTWDGLVPLPGVPKKFRVEPDTVPGEPSAEPSSFLDDLFSPVPSKYFGGVELGVNGAEGNSRNVTVLFLADGTRKNKYSTTVFNLLYTYAAADSVRDKNRLLMKTRRERPLNDSPWAFFYTNELLLDEFTAFDLRLAGHLGVSRQWLDNDRTQFKTRFGAGASREFGGPENATMPELIFGLSFDRKLTDTVKFTSNVDYFPDVSQFDEFRLDARAAFEFVIDRDLGLTFKVGVIDRYDSTPEGREPNDLEYFATLKWVFGKK